MAGTAFLVHLASLTVPPPVDADTPSLQAGRQRLASRDAAPTLQSLVTPDGQHTLPVHALIPARPAYLDTPTPRYRAAGWTKRNFGEGSWRDGRNTQILITLLKYCQVPPWSRSFVSP